MATFITRGKFSAEGAKGLVSKPEDRTQVVGKLVAAAGGKLLHYYVTTGDSDFILITEADNVDGAVAAAMAAAASGAVSEVSTSQAWTSAEFKKIAEKAGTLTGSYRAPGKS